MTEKLQQVQNITTSLSIYLAGLFIVMCLIYLCACPSAQLATAICAEIVAVAISIVIWKCDIFRVPSTLFEKLPARMKNVIARIRTIVQCCKLLLVAVLAAALTTDFFGLALAMVGAYGASATAYSVAPISYCIGLHPAFSLEILAGALVEHHDYARAQPLYSTLLDVRTRVAGDKSDLVGALYCDLGDFSVRKGDLQAAGEWYGKSAALGPRTGRAYTALATVLREEGQYSLSRKYYIKALALRKDLYGIASRQYNDTLRGFERLQSLTGTY